MSKTYENTIDIFADEKTLKKQIMSIVTDSKGLEDKKDPDSCNIFNIYKLIANKDDVKKMKHMKNKWKTKINKEIWKT